MAQHRRLGAAGPEGRKKRGQGRHGAGRRQHPHPQMEGQERPGPVEHRHPGRLTSSSWTAARTRRAGGSEPYPSPSRSFKTASFPDSRKTGIPPFEAAPEGKIRGRRGGSLLMAFVNYNNKEITAKIVYYGPALSGKTTCLRYIFNCDEIENKGKLITLDTDGDRTLFFDFLPLEIGKLGNYSIKIQLYTVPGPGGLRHHPQAGAAGGRRRGVRRRFPGRHARTEHRELHQSEKEPQAQQPAIRQDAADLPVQQTGPEGDPAHQLPEQGSESGQQIFFPHRGHQRRKRAGRACTPSSSWSSCT